MVARVNLICRTGSRRSQAFVELCVVLGWSGRAIDAWCRAGTRPIAKADGRTGRRLLALPRLTRVAATLQVLMVDGRRQPTAGVPFEHELI